MNQIAMERRLVVSISKVASFHVRQLFGGGVKRVLSTPMIYSRNLHHESNVSSSEPDKLYKDLQVEVRGHDRAVLDSYQWFTQHAAKCLGIHVEKTWEPKKVHERQTLLRSAFAKKKYLVQYEQRTYFRVMQLKHLTGSTADTYLEYIQRNLPEGVAMKVTKHEIGPIPEHIKEIPQTDSNS